MVLLEAGQGPRVHSVPVAAFLQDGRCALPRLEMKGIHEITVGRAIIGPKFEGLPKTGDGVVELSHFLEGIAKIANGVRMAWVDTQGLAKTVTRAASFALRKQHNTQIVVGVRMVRPRV